MNHKSSRPSAAVAYTTLVGKAVLAHREGRGLKQSDFAAQVGLSQSALSRVESGESVINVAQLHRFAQALHVSPAELIQEADAMARELVAQGVEVQHEKPDNAAAVAVGLGLLAALLLSK